MLRASHIIVCLIGIFLLTNCVILKTERQYAVARLQDTKTGKVVGTVSFTELKNFQTEIEVKLHDLQGDYVLHIHEFGDLTGADYENLGKIFDPLKNKQKRSSDITMPVGLLGVLEGVTHDYQTSFVKNNLALQRRFSVIGRALVLHSIDNHNKLAIGVIGRSSR